jgi:hypothetical protein
MSNISAANHPYILATRLALLLFFGALCVLVSIAWRRRENKKPAPKR